MFTTYLFLAFFLVQDIPFKPNEEFEIKLDYQFKPRPMPDHNSVVVGEFQPRYGDVLPYLTLDIHMLKLPGEKMRVRIERNMTDRPVFRKIDTETVLHLDLGFTIDMKDRVKDYQYTLTFVNADKQPVDKIVIRVEDDGAFIVNGEKRGKL